MIFVSRLAEPIVMPPPVVRQPGDDSVRLLIILLTPAEMPRIHQILLSHIARMYDSEFLEERLYEAETAEKLRKIIETAEQVSLAG